MAAAVQRSRVNYRADRNARSAIDQAVQHVTLLVCDVGDCVSTYVESIKPGFHLNAIACVGKQPVTVATASTEHSYWLALAFVA